MLGRAALELTVLVHFLFILFVIFGALFTHKRALLRWLHWTSLSYGLLVELFNWYCPLTLLEWRLRQELGSEAYKVGFIEYHVRRLIHWDVPQSALVVGAIVVVGVNAWIYAHRTLPQRPKQSRSD